MFDRKLAESITRLAFGFKDDQKPCQLDIEKKDKIIIKFGEIFIFDIFILSVYFLLLIP
jgi:hypothetical protein